MILDSGGLITIIGAIVQVSHGCGSQFTRFSIVAWGLERIGSHNSAPPRCHTRLLRNGQSNLRSPRLDGREKRDNVFRRMDLKAESSGIEAKWRRLPRK